jgi:threonine synthase
MKYYSTNNRDRKVSLREAVIQGLAPDNGLYMPEYIPVLPDFFINALADLTLEQIGFEVAVRFVHDDVPENELRKIIEHTIQFDAPLVAIEENVYSQELFHGPTLAFKDFGARFLSGLLGYFAQQENKTITILVATSGDTGSAVANAFLNVPGTRVVVLYPAGKVSEVQEKQFTTLGSNITALEVTGTFDDCQRLVKAAFMDADLKKSFFLTSANSINIARLIPQSFYYFYAYAHLAKTRRPLVVSVPSGNFGNLTAGLIAKRMGLPITKFVAATNVNAVVPEFLNSGVFLPRTSKQTISNAMDVGNPSNFVRMLDLYNQDSMMLANDVAGYSFTDTETKGAMKSVFEKNQYILDPHGAVGYLGLKTFLQTHPEYSGVFLETAHPAKFIEVVEEAILTKPELPERLNKFLAGKKNSIPISSKFEELKSLLPSLLT